MAAPRIPHWVTITLHAQSQLQDQVMVFSYESTPDIGSETECANIAQSFWSAVGTFVRNCTVAAVTFTRVVVTTHYPQPTNYTGLFDIVPPQPGNLTGDQEAQNVAEVVSWRSGVIGRSFRGRNFMFGAPENDIVGSSISGTQIARLQTMFSAIATYGGTVLTALRMVIASRRLLLLIDIASAFIDIITKSQRDRVPGERRHRRRPPT